MPYNDFFYLSLDSFEKRLKLYNFLLIFSQCIDLNKIEQKSGLFAKRVQIDEKTEVYKPFVSGLLAGWQEMEKNVDLINAILSSHFTPLSEPITRFTPKWED